MLFSGRYNTHAARAISGRLRTFGGGWKWRITLAQRRADKAIRRCDKIRRAAPTAIAQWKRGCLASWPDSPPCREDFPTRSLFANGLAILQDLGLMLRMATYAHAFCEQGRIMVLAQGVEP